MPGVTLLPEERAECAQPVRGAMPAPGDLDLEVAAEMAEVALDSRRIQVLTAVQRYRVGDLLRRKEAAVGPQRQNTGSCTGSVSSTNGRGSPS